MSTLLSSPLRRLQLVGRIEGVTLLVLLLVAVPLRHMLGYPVATRILGPVHGLAFILYAATLIDAVSGGGWSRQEAMRAVVAAIVPFGTFFNDRTIGAKIAHERTSA